MAIKRKPGLKKGNIDSEYNSFQVDEMLKCATDPIYFINNYVYIKHAKRGKIKFKMYDYQKEIIHKYNTQRFNIVLSARQTGKTETSCAYLLWSAIFKDEQTILVASNKSKNAMEIIGKIQYAYEELPEWLKPGIDDNSWNKHECAFDNKSRIISTTTSADSGRGMAISLLYVDEFAFVKPHISREFYDSILPTISTGGHMIVSSTPNGDVGQYAELWRGANAGINDFQHGITYVAWDAPPGRDEAFKQKFIGLLGIRKWRQEYECEFLTEELTLIDSDVVTRSEQLIHMKIAVNELIAFAVNDSKFQFFKRLEKNMTYLVGVDPCTGSGNDNGVFQVYEFPSMEQVLEYTTQTLSPHVMYTELKSLLNFLHTVSDEVYFAVENNGVGQGILAAYEGDMNPPEAAMISDKGKVGVNSNTKTKLRACLQFKALYERDKLTINSPQLLTELKSFIRHSGSYAAQTGATDDRIMATIVVFYMIQRLSERNGDAYDIVYSVASEIEAAHGWSAEVNPEDVLPQTERSETLNSYFESLHSASTVRSGIFL